jgi:very-short-patch-repair endonuclease
VFDLSDVLPLGRLARVLDDAWGLKLLKADGLYETLEELRGRGRGRVAWMRMLIEERGHDYSAPESGLERRFRRLLEKDGQPPMEYQVDVGGDQWIARVDALDRKAKLIVQIDSERHHSSLLDRRKDEQQDTALRALGWTVVRITEADLVRRPAWVATIVRAARSVASAA